MRIETNDGVALVELIISLFLQEWGLKRRGGGGDFLTENAISHIFFVVSYKYITSELAK